MNDIDDRLNAAAEDLLRTVESLSLIRSEPGRLVHRRSSVRFVALAAAALLVVIGLIAIRSRSGSSIDASTKAIAPRSQAALTAYALDGSPGAGLPVQMSDHTGGDITAPTPTPRVDVWAQGDIALVVHTVNDGSGEIWGNRPVTGLTVRGAQGAEQDLSVNQHAIWTARADDGSYSVIIGRNITSKALLTIVDSMIESDGALQPSSGFLAVERHPAVPDPPVSPYAEVAYSFDKGPWVSTTRPPEGHTSIETALRYQFVGRLEDIDGREVLVVDDLDRTFASWLEPSGELVTVIVLGEGQDMTGLVRSIKMIGPDRWTSLSHSVSESISAHVPVFSIATIGTATMVLRQDSSTQALCLRIDGSNEMCAGQPTHRPQPMLFISAEAEVDGHWYIYGYRSNAVDTLDDAQRSSVRFRDADGTDQQPDWSESATADWYIVRLPDGRNSIDTNQGEMIGGVSGALLRPLLPTVL